jgi:hypothetical protein
LLHSALDEIWGDYINVAEEATVRKQYPGGRISFPDDRLLVESKVTFEDHM